MKLWSSFDPSELNCFPNALWTDGVLLHAVHFIGCVSGSVSCIVVGNFIVHNPTFNLHSPFCGIRLNSKINNGGVQTKSKLPKKN